MITNRYVISKCRLGFTLIELMIVVAVMCIISHSFIGFDEPLFSTTKAVYQTVEASESLTRAYVYKKRFLESKKMIVDCQANAVTFQDGSKILLKNDGTTIIIGKARFDLRGGAVMRGFKKLDDKTYMGIVTNREDRIITYWRVGE